MCFCLFPRFVDLASHQIEETKRQIIEAQVNCMLIYKCDTATCSYLFFYHRYMMVPIFSSFLPHCSPHRLFRNIHVDLGPCSRLDLKILDFSIYNTSE